MTKLVDHFHAPAANRSPSAEMVAVVRAAHQLIDAEPLVLRDPLALQIVGEKGARWLRDNRAMLDLEYLRRMRGMLVVRSRICEDALRRAVAAGTDQYVLLGAGLDTFAYRSPELADRLTVFEVDQPGTQQWKLERLAEGGIAIPANLRFVPVDFNTGTLEEGLAAAGFRRDRPAFFAWLGVSYYLPRESIIDTLRFVATQRRPSEIVFDFAVDETGVPAGFRHLYHQLRAQMHNSPEPWRTWFAPAEILATLREVGFDDLELLDAEALQARHLADRRDGLLPGPLMSLVLARTRAA